MPLFQDGDCPPLRNWSEIGQIAGFAGCALFINFAIGQLILPLGFNDSNEFKETVVDSYGIFLGFIWLTIFAPLSETFVGQMLPLGVARLLRRTPIVQIAWSAAWFALLHIPNGPAHILQNFGAGWVFAVSFLFGWKESWIKAYRLTCCTHALHNLIVFSFYLLSSVLG